MGPPWNPRDLPRIRLRSGPDLDLRTIRMVDVLLLYTSSSAGRG